MSICRHAVVRKTKKELNSNTDCSMYPFFERSIRGGQSVIVKKYAKANSKYINDFKSNEKSYTS